MNSPFVLFLVFTAKTLPVTAPPSTTATVATATILLPILITFLSYALSCSAAVLRAVSVSLTKLVREQESSGKEKPWHF